MDYKEIRRIHSQDLRELCINKNWYTMGTNEQYHNLLVITKKDNITTEDIYKMAIDIYHHSDLDNDHEISEHLENIMFLIAKKCDTLFEKK